MSLKVLVTGAGGLLAYSLRELQPEGMALVFWDRKHFDLTCPDRMAELLRTLRPDWVINTAAYNLVDRCESERNHSWAVNAKGPESLARICHQVGSRLMHFSSDYVFDGAKRSPYEETDPPHPLNHYGAGKLYGETAVLETSPHNVVIRTSWLFGPHPTQTKSYVHSVLRQALQGGPLKAVTDQVAAPTYAPDLAKCAVELIRGGAAGLFHVVNDEGLSRYEWTLEILAAAHAIGILPARVSVEAVETTAFGPAIRRPPYSVLSNHKASTLLNQPL
ncbi:MAG TPA: dTDP-4-dehydrorhamnose reductase, partial [Candidatus Paceibacterota bacterium]|nr:dTDP-4-dehydrorhamnose reductase [Candidatus Paceibacterota bacterium]